MSNIFFKVFGISAIMLLSACNLDTQYNLSSRNVINVAESGKTGYGIGYVAFQVAGCAADYRSLLLIASQYYNFKGQPSCVTRDDLQDWVVLEITYPIIPRRGQLPGRYPTGVSVEKTELSGTTRYKIYGYADIDRLKAFKADISAVDPTVNLNVHKVSFILKNDENETFTLGTTAAWVEGVPKMTGFTKLEPQSQVHVLLSDVFSEELVQSGEVLAATLSFKE